MVKIDGLKARLEGPGKPKYLRISEYLREQIQAGAALAGEPLPTEQSLASRLNVARNTIRKSLAELEKSGLVQRTAGRGTFVRDAQRRASPGGRAVQRDMLGLLLPRTDGPFFESLLSGFQEQAEKADGSVVIATHESLAAKQADALLRLLDCGVGGVGIVAALSPITPAYQLRPLERAGVSVVLMVESVPHWDGPIVTYSRPRAAAEAADVLVERGYQRLGFFSLVPDEGAKQLEASFCERADQLGRPVPPGRRQYLFQTVQEADAVWEELSQQQSQARVAQLLEAQAKDPERPEAYFVAYQPHAERMLMAAGQLGLRLPQDLGIITTGASTRSTPMSAMIDTIGIDSRQIGRRAAQLLRHALGGHRPEAADATIELEVQRLCGTTLRPA